MSGYCTRRKSVRPGKSSAARIIGIVLIAVGVLVLLLFVPCWVWTSVLAVLLISIGFLVWRFG